MSSTQSQRAGRAEQVLPKNLPPEGVQQQDSWSETGPAKGLQKETREQKVQSDSTRETKQKVLSDSTRANSVVEESHMLQREQAKRLMILKEPQVQQQAQPQSGVCRVFQTEHRVLTKMPQIFVVMKDVQQEYHAIRETQEKVQIQFIAPKEVQPEHQDLKKVQLENEVVEIAKPKTQILNAPERKTPEPLGLVQPEEDLQHESDVWDKVKGDTTELNDWEQDTKLLMDLRQVTRILAQLEPQLGTKNETKLKTNNPKIPHQITAVTVELQPVNKALTQPQLASEVFQRQLKLAREAINKAHNNVRPPKRSQSKSRQLIKMNPETKGGHYSRETQFGIQQQDEQQHWTQPQCRTQENAWSPRETRKGVHAETESGTRILEYAWSPRETRKGVHAETETRGGTRTLEDAWSPRETRKGVHAETETRGGTRTLEDAWSPRETRKGMHAETETRGGTQDEVDMPTRETNEGIKPEPETQDNIQQDRKRQEGIQPVMKILKQLEAKHKRMTQRESTIETPETRCITAVRLEKLQLEGRVPSKQKTESNTLAGPRVPMDIQKDSHTLKRTRAECVALKEVKPETESQRNSQRETGLLEELQPVSMILQELQKKYDKPNEPPPKTHKSNQLCQDTGGLIALQTENEIHKLNRERMILTKPIPKYEAPTDPVPETATKESKRGRFEVSERKLLRGVHKEMLSEVRTENGPCKEVQTEPENQEKVVRKRDKHTCKHSHELPGRKTSVSSTPSPKNNFRTETDHQDGEVQTATHEEGVNALRASPSSSITLSFLPVLHAPRMIVPPSTAVQKEPTAEHEGSKVETRHESDKQIHTKLRDNTMMEKDILDAIAISILPSSSSRSSTAVTLERKTTPVTKVQMNKDLDGCGEVVLVPQKSSESQEQQKTYHQEKENNQNEIAFLSGFSASSSSFSCVSSVASDSLSQIQPRAEDYFKRSVYPQVKESLQQSQPTSESKHAKNAKEEKHSKMTSSSPSCELFLSLSATANNVTQCQNSKLQSEVQEDTELQETAQTKTKLQQTTATEEDAQFYISFASNSSSMSSLSPVPSVNDPFASKLDNHLQPETEMSQDVGKEHRQRELMNPETKPLKPNVSNEAAVICSTMVSSSSSSELQVESSVNVIGLTCRQPEKEPESKECRQGDVNHACSGADITTQSNVDAAEAKETQPKAEASPLKRMNAEQEVEVISSK
ncbi:hypothetical protein V1264_006741 [Littorina saxatilis]|uniref:Uncharacterized protein n=1 Tax=Littorina saxatilis TaxID=31220 RepID=A0AAN9AYK1_9CAEN